MAWITGNWANALGNDRRPRRRAPAAPGSAEAQKKAGRPAINVIGSELEALRIDIMQGKAEAALPQVEARLAQVEGWWQRHRSGERVPEAPDAEALARAFISALDIAKEAHCALDDWESALRRTDTVLEVKRALERPAEDIAVDSDEPGQRARTTSPLRRGQGRVGRVPPGFPERPDPHVPRRSVPSPICSTSKATWPRPSPRSAAPSPSREQLPDPDDRAISHNNLAIYLERSGTPSALAESTRHRLAALIY